MATAPIPQDVVNNATSKIQKYDVIVIGAGFSGMASLYRLRKDGFKVHVFEGASDFGGVWYWNRYPGARVDSEFPLYQLSIPEVYNSFAFSQRFPDHAEIRRYTAHVDRVLGLRKDVSFDSRVNSVVWDAAASQWHIQTENGLQARAKWIIFASGLLHRTYTPDFPGLSNYKGVVHHSGSWPETTDVKNKRVAIIGAGATAVQITQEIGKEQGVQLSVLVRRPSYCVPIGQRTITEEEQVSWRTYYPALFASGRLSQGGFPGPRSETLHTSVDPKDREAHFESMWARGGFSYLIGQYADVLIDRDANRIAYEFWKKKVRQRLTDPAKQKILAPDEPPYYFGTKRVPLERDYYDVLNQKNVEVVDLKANALEGFTEKGIKLEGEDKPREFDVVVLATGFDAFSGSLTSMGLKNKDGVDIKDVWSDGIKTYMGMTMHGFPNAFMVYTPQAPTALSNGPTILEAQRDWICDVISLAEKQGVKVIEAKREAEEEWKKGMNEMNEVALFKYTDSWWTGANIPGKVAENNTYIGGIDNYEAQARAAIPEWKGFEVTPDDSQSVQSRL
ncbi:hypothetical protein B0J11DRAFT_128838 [Dendryphion nanum]|uniref:FAD/NAD(P)-binding domain-containing protein n=1 Tax=Dendryphion nanum TaxID=256645 RepID=A0A9P9DA88_9PLEO|nr:hypothetical protein B0J11DRAFT_128838 [Dendryphion nanum]